MRGTWSCKRNSSFTSASHRTILIYQSILQPVCSTFMENVCHTFSPQIRKGRQLLKYSSFLKPNIFNCIKVLQQMGRPFGISYEDHIRGCSLSFDSVMLAVMVIWYSGCSLGTEFFWPGCGNSNSDVRMIVLVFGLRLIQFSPMFFFY